MWSWRDSNPHPSPDGECSVIESTTPAASSFGPPYPSRIMARTPIGLVGFNYEKQKIVSIAYILMLSHDYLLRQRDCSEHGSRPGYGGRTPPVASDLLDLSQVCSLLLSCSQHVNELALLPWVDSHSPSSPFGGVLLLNYTGGPHLERP